MDLSNRIKNMQFSPIRKLSSYADSAKGRGINIIGLNIGQPDIPTPEVFFKALNNFPSNVLEYSDSRGIEPLRKSMSKYYTDLGYDIKDTDILITNGGSEALLFTLLSICDVDDEVIIPEPFYTNYNSFSDIASVKVVPFKTLAEEGFKLPKAEDIEKLISPKTKALLISNPGNPTGAVYDREDLNKLVNLAIKHNLYIISDEVYREFVYDNLTFTSLLDFPEIKDRVIIIDSISKRYSACGARIGSLVTKNVNLISNALKLCQARLCSPTLEQLAAAELINVSKDYFTEVIREYQERRDILFNALTAVPDIICKKPSGAFYLIAKLPIEDAEKFAVWLLENFSMNNKTVMIAPASGFYSTKGLGKDEIRLSYCVNQEELKAAAEILIEGLKEYKKYNK